MAAPGSKPLNPWRLDVAALADRGEGLHGHVALASLDRLMEDEVPHASPQTGDAVAQAATRPEGDAHVTWSAQAEWRPVRGGAPELWLHLAASASVTRTCQRCLQPVLIPVDAQRSFLFAASEDQAQAWDAERDDADVLVLTRSLNLIELVEDELLLALPLVPRHEVCPSPLQAPWPEVADDAATSESDEMSPEEVKKDNPFAILAQLKRGKG
jgi:uncharacterized protein